MLPMHTYYIRSRPITCNEVYFDWANYKPTSKHAGARELRFKARHRNRR